MDSFVTRTPQSFKNDDAGCAISWSRQNSRTSSQSRRNVSQVSSCVLPWSGCCRRAWAGATAHGAGLLGENTAMPNPSLDSAARAILGDDEALQGLMANKYQLFGHQIPGLHSLAGMLAEADPPGGQAGPGDWMRQQVQAETLAQIQQEMGIGPEAAEQVLAAKLQETLRQAREAAD